MSDLTSYEVGGDIMEHVVQGVQGGADEASVAGANVSSAQMWVSLLESLLVVLVILMVFVLGKMILKKMAKKDHKPAADASDSANLASNGWYLYTRPGCPWCHKQLDALGGKFNNQIDCTTSGPSQEPPAGAPACNDSRISGYPYWYNVSTGESKSGYQDQVALAKMGCPIAKPQDCSTCPAPACPTPACPTPACPTPECPPAPECPACPPAPKCPSCQ